MDIRNFILDSPDSCEITCFHLEHDGKPLNDYVEVGAYAPLLTKLANNKLHSVQIVPDFYDERSAKLHVRRLRELLVNPPAHVTTTNLLSEAKTGTKAALRIKSALATSGGPNKKNPFTLTGYYDNNVVYTNKRQVGSIQECVGNLGYSAWNPPPGNRRLFGDLFYLEVTTLENNTLHITASVDGFFLNQSTNRVFNPLPHASPYRNHSLADLLKRASSQFNSRFNSILNRKISSHPFETVDLLHDVYEWNIKEKNHTYDWNRAEDSILSTFGMEARGDLRDWNAEYQACKELPITNEQEIMLRHRTTGRIYIDFAKAAIQGAVAVIEGNIPPINPVENKRSFVYIYNSIFFSPAIDAKNVYADKGGDDTAYANANHDLKGIEAISMSPVDDVHTLATAVLDYNGHRLIAQSIIPGIFHGDKATTHAYGCMDHSENIQTSKEFHERVVAATAHLHTHGHMVQDSEGKTDSEVVQLATCVDTKGLIGSDGRNYLLDVIRTTPRDANFPDPATHSTALLRSELIHSFVRTKGIAKYHALVKEAQAQALENKKKGIEAKVTLPGQEQLQAFVNEYSFNTDLLMGFPEDKLKASPEQYAADLKLLQEASTFLLKVRIPQLMAEFKALKVCPPDSNSLRTALHNAGINLRYLGHITTLAKAANLKHIEDMCLQEMVVRAAKKVLGSIVREVRPTHGIPDEHCFVAPCIAKFLSSFLGPQAGGIGIAEEELKAASQFLKSLADNREEERKEDKIVKVVGNKKKGKGKRRLAGLRIKLKDGSFSSTDPLDPANVWQAIKEQVTKKYTFNLSDAQAFTSAQKLTMLRSLCQKFGIQVATKDYDFKETSAFTAKDILGLFPIVKYNLPGVATEAIQLLENGKIFVAQGKLQYAFQYLHTALQQISGIFGPMHELTAQCYTHLILVSYHVGDFPKAVENGESALIICQRSLGLDHADTAAAHSNLSLFLHSSGHFDQALVHIKRAIYLFELIAGKDHPETASANLNIAMIYQDMDRLSEALLHLQEALRSSKAALGAESLHVAICEHALAVAYGFTRNFGKAIAHERVAQAIYKKLLGEENSKYKQSTYWLKQFAAHAAALQKALDEQGEGKAAEAVTQTQAAAQAKTSLLSPLTWTSLRNSTNTPFKGRVSINDMFRKYRRQVEKNQASGAAANATAPQATSTASQPTETSEGKKTHNGGGNVNRNQRKKKNKAAKKALERAKQAEAEAETIREQQRLRQELLAQQQLKAQYEAKAKQEAAKNAAPAAATQ